MASSGTETELLLVFPITSPVPQKLGSADGEDRVKPLGGPLSIATKDQPSSTAARENGVL